MGVVPPPPTPAPMLPANPQLFRNPFKATSEVLVAAKAALKGVVPMVVEVAVVVPRAPVVESAPDSDVDNKEHSYAVLLAAPPSPALEILIGDEDNDDNEENEDASMLVNFSSVVTNVSQPKKAKLSAHSSEANDPMSSSPDLPHKMPSRMKTSSE